MNIPYDPLLQEAGRIEALRQLELLDTAPSEAFDRITRMAAQLFQLPIAAVSLTDTDRQWFKSKVGVDHDAIPRMKAPCAEVADSGRMLEVPDLLESVCFRDSPLADSGIRFYLGAPLVTKTGHCLGAMCVLGTEPRTVTDADRCTLGARHALMMLPLEKTFIMEKDRNRPHVWRLSVPESGPGQLFWNVTVDGTPGKARIALAWQVPAPF